MHKSLELGRNNEAHISQYVKWTSKILVMGLGYQFSLSHAVYPAPSNSDLLKLSSTPHPCSNNAPTSSKLNPFVSGYIRHIHIQPAIQTLAYIIKVTAGVKNSIMGKNVNPTMKLAPQFVLVLSPDPRERTFRGKSSDCIHGTFPRPRA